MLVRFDGDRPEDDPGWGLIVGLALGLACWFALVVVVIEHV